MVLISVMYPSGPEATFDQAYYLGTHIPLVKERWSGLGLTDVQVLRGIASGSGGDPAYGAVALLSFGSAEEFKNAARIHGAEIFADIPRFTNSRPVVQISEVLN